MKRIIQILLLLISSVLCLVGCFGHSGKPYPSDWPMQDTGVGSERRCPDISGWYQIDHIKSLKDFSKFLYDWRMKNVEFLNLSMPLKIYFEQTHCKQIYFSVFNAENELLVDKADNEAISCYEAEVSYTNAEFIASPSRAPGPRRGGASFFIGSERDRMRLGVDQVGNLVENDISRLCGLVLIPPVPLCYSTSNTWYRYEKVDPPKLAEEHKCSK